MKFKLLVSVLLVVSMLVMINSAYATKKEESLEIVTEKQIGKQIAKAIVQNNEMYSFSKKDKNLLLKTLMGIGYDKSHDAYVAHFEHVTEEKTGWFVTVIYDSNSNKIIDGVRAEIGSSITHVETVNGGSGDISRKLTLQKIDCKDCGPKSAYEKPKLSFIESLVVDQTAHAGICDMSESEKCGWTSIPMCSLVGLLTGGWGGLVCAAVSMYVCTYVPLAETNCWGGRP